MTRSRTAATGAASLPSKEQSMFRNMFSLIEHKHYKKAAKQADQILKKFPDHGETISMKALILSNMGPDRKQEAYELAKRGLRLDIRNYVSWHVLGTMYRADKDYGEATKCFAQAFRLTPEHVQIAKDLSVLQLHERKYEAFRETRRQILATRSQYIREWTPFALANHLCGSLDTAVAVVSEMEKQFQDDRDLDAFDRSELMLYCAMLLEQAGRVDECLSYLQEREQHVVDRMSLLEMQGHLLLISGKLEEARGVYTELFQKNKNSEIYALALLACDADPRLRRLCYIPEVNALRKKKEKQQQLDQQRGSKKQQVQGNKENQSQDTTEQAGEEDEEAAACIQVLPGAIHSTGEGRVGWLPPPATKAKLQELLARAAAAGVLPLTGWKKRRNSTPWPLFLITRDPSVEEEQLLLRFFRDLATAHPGSSVPSLLALSFLRGETFQKHLDAYLRPALRKGVTSLFSTLRRLQTPNKMPIILSLLESYVVNLQRQPVASFGAPSEGGSSAASAASEGARAAKEDAKGEGRAPAHVVPAGEGNADKGRLTAAAAEVAGQGEAAGAEEEAEGAGKEARSAHGFKREDAEGAAATVDQRGNRGAGSAATERRGKMKNAEEAEEQQHQRAGGVGSEPGAVAKSERQWESRGELPTCLLYTYMLLAQQYDFLGRLDEALETIEKGIKHTPTMADLYLVKGRILKHAGAYGDACECHEMARSLDLADRYLNTKACNYLLRVNKGEQAAATARLFSRQSDAEGLHGMQCMWLEQKMGKQHLRRGLVGPALYEFFCILKHFHDIRDDQFDFHPYCLRRFAYRAYINFLRMQDRLFSHLFLRRAARRYIRTYFSIFDGVVDVQEAKERAKAFAAQAQVPAPAAGGGSGKGGSGGATGKGTNTGAVTRGSESSSSNSKRKKSAAAAASPSAQGGADVVAAESVINGVVPGSKADVAATTSEASAKAAAGRGVAGGAGRGGATEGKGGGAAAASGNVADDPSGVLLLEKDPLVQVEGVLHELLLAAVEDQHTHVLHYHFAMRKRNGLAMILAVMRLWRLTGKVTLSPRLLPLLLHFFSSPAALEAAEAGSTASLIRAAVQQLMPSLEVKDEEATAQSNDKGEGTRRSNATLLRAAAQQHWCSILSACEEEPWNFRLRRAAVQALLLCPEILEKATDVAVLQFQPFPPLSEEKLRFSGMPTLRECEQLYDTLLLLPPGNACTAAALAQFRDICRARFPRADLFQEPVVQHSERDVPATTS